ALKDFRPDYEAAGLGALAALKDARPDYEAVVSAGLGGVRSALMDARPHYEAVVSAGLGDVRSALKDFRPDYEAAGLGALAALKDARPDYEAVVSAGLGDVRSALKDARPHYEAVVSASLKAMADSSRRAAASGREVLDVDVLFEEIDAYLEDAPADSPTILHDQGLRAVWREAAAPLRGWLGQPKVKVLGSFGAFVMLSAWWLDLKTYHPDVAELIEVPFTILVGLLIQLVFMVWPRDPK
ncbi:hypothetical protein, partial [Actinoplanes sp. NPDC026623]|uniref:hypothetical protein n=1 Tax=Actinoplanes sp. NPDC026623 TaxID=3155610 RepID=UPI0033C18CC5